MSQKDKYFTALLARAESIQLLLDTKALLREFFPWFYKGAV
jgi:hypothetical protein